MNFYKTLGLKNSRIDVADALRGLAVAGIILYHSVEHFNMYDGSIEHAYTLGCDDWMADVLAFAAVGKDVWHLCPALRIELLYYE